MTFIEAKQMYDEDPNALLTDEQMDKESAINRANGYGINKKTAQPLLIKAYQVAQEMNSIDDGLKIMARIDYRLTAINFHCFCGLLARGDYTAAKKWIENAEWFDDYPNETRKGEQI